MIGELTRLYQAALEEQRRVLTHLQDGDGLPHERVDAAEHASRERLNAHAALLDAFYDVEWRTAG